MADAEITGRGCTGLQTFRALRNLNFRLFWFGQIISVTGTWLQSIAQSWLVLQLTHSAFAIGVTTALQFLPTLLFGLFGGVFVDRFDKRWLLVGTQAAFGLQALALGLLASSRTVQLWEIYLLVVCFGLVNVIDNPARQAFAIEMVGPDDLPNAIALNSTAWNGARVVGPAVGGAIIASAGVAACFFYNAASYVAVIAGLLLIRAELLHSARARPGEGVLDALRAGLAYARQSRTVLLVIGLMTVIGTFGLNFQVLLPVLADGLRVGAVGFGFLTSATGVGSLIGALAIASSGRATVPMLLAGAISLSLLELALWLPLGYVPALALLLLAGGASITYMATSNSLVQLTSPDELRGRIMSLYAFVFLGSTPIGAPIIGAVAAAWGAPAGFGAGGAISLVAAVAGLVAVRRFGGRGAAVQARS